MDGERVDGEESRGSGCVMVWVERKKVGGESIE